MKNWVEYWPFFPLVCRHWHRHGIEEHGLHPLEEGGPLGKEERGGGHSDFLTRSHR